MDIVHGDLTDETIGLVDQLDPDDLALPMAHLVRYVQGMNMAQHMRASINRDPLDELRIITIEQQEELYPTPELEPPSRRPDAPIPDLALSGNALSRPTSRDDEQEMTDWLIYNLSGMIERLKRLRR